MRYLFDNERKNMPFKNIVNLLGIGGLALTLVLSLPGQGFAKKRKAAEDQPAENSVTKKKSSAGKLATQISISLVDGIAVDANDNIYLSFRDSHTINRIDAKGGVTPVAGTGKSGFGGDGGPALNADLKIPAGLAFDKEGNLYIADRENHRVRKVDAKGMIATIAGNGTAGFGGDGGPATQASLNLPSGLVFDENGNLYIADRSNNRIRIVDSKGIIKTFAGTGAEGFQGDGGPALQAVLDKPFGLAMDNKRNLYIADRNNNRIRKVDASGNLTTIAGDGGFFFSGDNGPSARASIAGPTGLAVDSAGNLYIADRNNNRVRMVDPQGMIHTVVGTGQRDYNGDSEVARETNLHLPFGVAFDRKGNLLVIDRSNYRIRRVNLSKGKVETIAGNGVKMFQGDGGPANGASLSFPHGIVVDSKDNVIFSDKANNRIRKITPEGIITTIAGDGTRGTLGNGGPALKGALYTPTNLSVNNKDELFITSPSGFVSIVRKIDAKGYIYHYVGTADEKYMKAIKDSPDKGRSAESKISPVTQISDLIMDKHDNLFIVDRINHQIRKIDAAKNVSTIAGTGDSDFTGDGGPAAKANFRDPISIVLDKEGNIFVGDAANNRIRKIDTKGIITTYAGNGDHEDNGDGGPAVSAGILGMDDLAFSPSGELYIAGSNAHVVRKITKDGIIQTVAGHTAEQGFSGDGGPATSALLKSPTGIAFDSKGNLYVSDLGNNLIRKVDTKGIITTFAGNSVFGWAHEGETVEIYFQNFP
jgi:sugar lactone lactonase YvrE